MLRNSGVISPNRNPAYTAPGPNRDVNQRGGFPAAYHVRNARKIVRAPRRLALSNSMGNGNGAVWISSIERRPDG